MSSVGQAYAVLAGRITGNKQDAEQFLGSMFKKQLDARNVQENRSRNKGKKPYKIGQRARN